MNKENKEWWITKGGEKSMNLNIGIVSFWYKRDGFWFIGKR